MRTGFPVINFMTFLWPWTLLALVPVAAVALWTLFRPGRRLAVIGTLSLWKQTFDTLDRISQRKSRHVTTAWLVLLAGAIAAALAGARPVYYTSGLARRVAIAVVPSSELGGQEGLSSLRQAIGALLQRLEGHDLVQFVFPAVAGGAESCKRASQAHERLAALTILNVSADKTSFPQPHQRVQHVYQFAPPSAKTPTGPRFSRIEIPTYLPPVTIDALAAETTSNGKMQLFVALRNHSDEPQTLELAVHRVLDSTGKTVRQTRRVGPVAPRSRLDLVEMLDDAAALAVGIPGDDGGHCWAAFLVRQRAALRKVALIGRDDPYLRRLVKVDPTLRVTANVAKADVVIANGVSAPADKAALVIHPPTPPGAWRTARRQLASFLLASADVAVDDPVMRSVDLSGTALRLVKPWVQGGSSDGDKKILVACEDGALILRDSGGGVANGPRRVYVAFDLSEDNCTLVRTDAYVVFLANVIRYLAPAAKAGITYGYLTPREAGLNPSWQPVFLTGSDARGCGAILTPPGLYQDPKGTLHAVSLVGLRGGRPQVTPDQVVSSLPLPPPRPVEAGIQLWPALLAIAMGLWLTGWALTALPR